MTDAVSGIYGSASVPPADAADSDEKVCALNKTRLAPMTMSGELTGTPNQIEWAEQIRFAVAQEFDRVAKAFQAQAGIQTGRKQAETRAIIAILEQKRAETMSIRFAAYFIREWRELNDQVRQMIAKDSRYQAIRDQRTMRQRAAVPGILSAG